MFEAAYSTEFYRAVRDALHAEVDSWRGSQSPDAETAVEVDALWSRVAALEPISRNTDAFISVEEVAAIASPAFVSIEKLVSVREV